MSRSLLIPVAVDALYLANETDCAEARLDFSRLPYYNGKEDVNPYVAYLGEEIQSVPFKNGDFKLKKGVHLHWALPDALTKSVRRPLLDRVAARRVLGNEEVFYQTLDWCQQNDWVREIDGSEFFASIIVDSSLVDATISRLLSTTGEPLKMGKNLLLIRHLLEPGGAQMPPVPNRWIITRNHEKNDATTRRWVVESDFLAHAENGSAEKGISFPVWRENKQDPPFGWLGRSFPLSTEGDNWEAPTPATEDRYLGAPLTAIGYGEPTFAAFYPNCHSVFGFHDDLAYKTGGENPEINHYDPATEEFTYTILGYYSDEYLDYISILWNDNFNRYDPEFPKEAARELLAIYREELRFSFEYTSGASTAEPTGDPEAFLDHVPYKLLCGGRLKFRGTADEWAATPQVDMTLAAGHSGTEAMAAYLADKLANESSKEVEEFLESLQFSSSLDHLETDIGPKFKERRHEQGFTNDQGGWRWVLRPPAGKNEDNPAGANVGEQVALPEELAHFLHELNDLQLRFDRKEAAIKSLRQQIYADWTKYMICQYPPDGSEEEYPDPDEARFYIETQLLPQLTTMNEERQKIAESLRLKAESFWLLQAGDVPDKDRLFEGLLAVAPRRLGAQIEASGRESIIETVNNLIRHPAILSRILQPGQEQATAPPQPTLDESMLYVHLAENRRLLEATYPDIVRHGGFRLQHKPYHFFHRPVDPVILLAGERLRLSEKHGQDGLLACHYEGDQSTYFKSVSVINQWCDIIQDKLPLQIKSGRTNHPLLLDWLVEYFPILGETESGEELQTNYQLDLNAFDFRPRQPEVSPAGHNFWGTAILTDHAGAGVREQLEIFLKTELVKLDLASYFQQKGLTVEEKKYAWLFKNIREFNQEYQNKLWDPWYARWFHLNNGPPALQDAAAFEQYFNWDGTGGSFPAGKEPAFSLWESKHLLLALRAYAQLQETHYLSQSLGGFHQALLMRRAGFQLNLDDPLGYPDYQAFTKEVSKAVGLLNHASTLPNNPFYPLRAGACDLVELRLLDTFGLELAHLKDLEQQPVLAAEPLRSLNNDHHLHLPPRITQSARLNFNWLSAEDDDVERNEHPASSPVCGWLLINKLDGSLMIYDQQGIGMGYLDTEGRWRTFPGHDGPALPEGIANWQLRKMVIWLSEQARKQANAADDVSDTIPHFITLVEEALTKIEPARADHAGEGVAMLFSRPLALVRATAHLELQGHPAYHQGWKEFQAVINDSEANHPKTYGLEKAAFPLRLGEDHQLNDGLIGFWEDTPDGAGYQGDIFRVPSLHRQTDGAIDADHPVLDNLTIGNDGHGSPGIRFSLLMDPHGSVNATVGALPLQKLTLPPDLYVEALKHLEVSFLTAPIITSENLINISLPDEPGFHWSWIGKENRQWKEVSTVGHFRHRELTEAFADQAEGLWQDLQANGWITVTGEQAAIVPANKRPQNPAFPAEDIAPKLQLFLASRQINPFRMSPAFHEAQQIKEGWLKLRPGPTIPSLPIPPETS